MPAGRRRGDQLGVGELGEMAARGLRRHMRDIGELARRIGAAVHQRAQDIGARRIAHQRGDRRHVENLCHAVMIARRGGRRIGPHFGGGRTIRLSGAPVS